MNQDIDLNIFSPTAPLGIFILFSGLIFSSLILYVIYAVSTDKDSIGDKKVKDKKNSIQQEKIRKLFPQKK